MNTFCDLRASDIMTKTMVRVPADASVQKAAAVLIDHEISGAPVCDESGRIIGLVSLRDIARFERERNELESVDDADVKVVPGITSPEQRSAESPDAADVEGTAWRIGLPYGFHLEMQNPPSVQEIMSPITITVDEHAGLAEVALTMLERKVHRVLVRDACGDIVGLVSALDVMRTLARLDSTARQPSEAIAVTSR